MLKVDDGLLLFPLELEDSRELWEIFNDEENSKFLSCKKHCNVFETKAYLEGLLRKGEFFVIRNDQDKLIGLVGVIKSKDDSPWSIRYALHKSFWGKDITPKVIRKATDFWFEQGLCDQIEANLRMEDK